MGYVLVFLILFLFPAHAEAWPGRVVDVSDGDTITVEPADGGARVTIRLHGIDAPEKKQPGGESARGFVFDTVLYKVVEVEPKGRPDRYGRMVAIIYLPGDESLQAALLRAGLAWVWPRYCKNCDAWEAMQEGARQAGRGVWSQENPAPPWEWRRKQRSHFRFKEFAVPREIRAGRAATLWPSGSVE